MKPVERGRPALRDFLAVCFGILLIVVVMIPPSRAARRLSDKSSCKSNLKHLGNLISIYVMRYGSGREFPGAMAHGGGGLPVPLGPNGTFWSCLYCVPSPALAVSRRPGSDQLYECPVYGGRNHGSVTTLEYTGPAFGATWPAGVGPSSGLPVFPSGCLSDAVARNTPIGGDLIGPPDAPNHGGVPGAPDDDWWSLRYDGVVDEVAPDSERHAIYAVATTGRRTR